MTTKTEQKRAYRQSPKGREAQQRYQAKRKVKVYCECGEQLSVARMSTHLLTQRHQDNMAELKSIYATQPLTDVSVCESDRMLLPSSEHPIVSSQDSPSSQNGHASSTPSLSVA